ncbi:MAG: hypothetical protein HND47_02380 [Chloroflexi bacterium]|nr:hypothetical protein [Chloroflexota bacterium]
MREKKTPRIESSMTGISAKRPFLKCPMILNISSHSCAACTSPNPASGRSAIRRRASVECPPSIATNKPMLKKASP